MRESKAQRLTKSKARRLKGRRLEGVATNIASVAYCFGEDHPERDFRTSRKSGSNSRDSTFLSTRINGLLDERALVAEVRQRGQQVVAHVAGFGRGVGTGGSSSFGSRSFSSTTSRSAVFRPTPGIRVRRATSEPADGADELGRLDAGEHRQRDFRADAADADQALERGSARARVTKPKS